MGVMNFLKRLLKSTHLLLLFGFHLLDLVSMRFLKLSHLLFLLLKLGDSIGMLLLCALMQIDQVGDLVFEVPRQVVFLLQLDFLILVNVIC